MLCVCVFFVLFLLLVVSCRRLWRTLSGTSVPPPGSPAKWQGYTLIVVLNTFFRLLSQFCFLKKCGFWFVFVFGGFFGKAQTTLVQQGREYNTADGGAAPKTTKKQEKIRKRIFFLPILQIASVRVLLRPEWATKSKVFIIFFVFLLVYWFVCLFVCMYGFCKQISSFCSLFVCLFVCFFLFFFGALGLSSLCLFVSGL